MLRSPVERQMEDAARTYFTCVTQGDVEAILALFADDAQLINPMTGEEGIRSLLKRVWVGVAPVRCLHSRETASR